MQLEAIEDFKDFIQITSIKNIDFLSNRKQLMLYSPANIEQEESLSRMKAQFHTDYDDPVEGCDTSQVKLFGCITMLNLNDEFAGNFVKLEPSLSEKNL